MSDCRTEFTRHLGPDSCKSLPFRTHFLQLAACSLHTLRAASLPCIHSPFPRTQLALAALFRGGVGGGQG